MPEERSETVRQARRQTAANDPTPKEQRSRPPRRPDPDERTPDPTTGDLRKDQRAKGGATGTSG